VQGNESLEAGDGLRWKVSIPLERGSSPYPLLTGFCEWDGVHIVGSSRSNRVPRENPQLSEAATLNCDKEREKEASL
jgi:hypothetical protein